MPKISVIIPVYGAEKTLQKCVESLLYGQERDLELILIDDCSKDGSWSLCQRLAQAYPQVKIIQNETNSGVSFTRNRGLENATGQYILFVDSDDWVTGAYAKTLIDTHEANPGALVVCGYTFIDYTSDLRCYYGISGVERLPRKDFFRLSEAVLLQQLWNKVFLRSVIEENHIRFDETISMGEDYQFVVDYLEAIDCTECAIIEAPLYYYIRWNKNSLMGNWGDISNLDNNLACVERLRQFTGNDSAATAQHQALRRQFIYWTRNDKTLSKTEKQERIRQIMGEDGADVSGNWLSDMRGKLGELRRRLPGMGKRLSGRIQLLVRQRKIAAARKKLAVQDMSIISQNCIGGVFSHDMGLEFRSPTVNVFIKEPDFVKFVQNLEGYLKLSLEMRWGEAYPIGGLGDIEIHFMHYETCQEAVEAWERRKRRVNLDKVLVLATDRDGFDDAVFAQWQKIQYPKVLFTAKREYAGIAGSVLFPKYRKVGAVPDLIPSREFYKDGTLIAVTNQIGS